MKLRLFLVFLISAILIIFKFTTLNPNKPQRIHINTLYNISTVVNISDIRHENYSIKEGVTQDALENGSTGIGTKLSLQSRETEILQFIRDTPVSMRTFMKTFIPISLTRDQHFEHVMKHAGVPFFSLQENYQISNTWAYDAVLWWGGEMNQTVDVETLQNIMRFQSRISYRNFALNFMNGSYISALKALSCMPAVNEGQPGVAVFQNAVILKEGQIYNGSHKVYSRVACGGEHITTISTEGLKKFDIVVSIAQYFGSEYFHFIAENLVRVCAALHMFAQTDQVKLHVITPKPFMLEILAEIGVHNSRIISGDVLANFAVMPQPIPCGTPPAALLQITRDILVKRINPLMFVRENGPCEVLLVQRKGARQITNHATFLHELENNFPSCRVQVHTGTGALTTQMVMFRKSTVVVAPHGAGLVNILVCRKKTLIFELLVSGRDLNLCYMAMALKLQLKYISMTVTGSSQYGAMRVDLHKAMHVLKMAFTNTMIHSG